MKLSNEQQKCLQNDSNIIVSAGAGSGKTTVLAERFLALVKKGIPAHRILTLTFTRKATAEMEERILRRLLSEKDDPRASAAIFSHETLNISTLDSFCLKIVKSGARTLQLASGPSLNEKELYTSITKSCQKFLYEQAAHPMLQRLLLKRREVDPLLPVLYSLFVPLATEECPLFPEENFSQRSVRIIAWLKEQAEKEQERFLAKLDALLTMPSSPKTAVLQSHLRSLQKDRQYVEIANHLQTLNLTSIRDSSLESVSMRKTIKELRRTAGDLSLFLQSQNLRLLSDDYQQLYELLSKFQHYIQQEKRQYELFSFSDIMDLALYILRKDWDIRHYFQESFSAIMADEFQDNNHKQRDLLFLLAQDPHSTTPFPKEKNLSPGKLFLVGDEKQSIYRFRGAEVAVFTQLAQNLTQENGLHLHLSTNYRSTPSLVGFFNTAFQHMQKGPPMVSALPDSPTSHLCLAYTFATNDAEQRPEAVWVAQRIAELIAQKIPMEKSEDRIAPADIAILMRTSTHKGQFERALQKRGITFQSTSTQSVFSEALATDLYHLLDLLLYPENTLSYATLLRSPVVNLSDQALLQILSTKTLPPFSPRDDLLLPEDQEKYLQAQQMFQTLQQEFIHMHPAGFLHYFWYYLGYRYHILESASYHSLLSHYEALLDFATSYEMMVPFYLGLRKALAKGDAHKTAAYKSQNFLKSRGCRS